jgi:GDP-L-fucose synthase
MQKDSKIYIAGHRGLVGSAIERVLRREGFTNIIGKTRQELNLTISPK